VIHNSIDFPPNTSGEALARLGVQPPYILYAGSFEPRKNLVGAAAAYALLARDVPHDLVAVVERQSGHSQDALTELRKMGLGDRVKLVHSLPEADLRALYTGADVLFFPSLAEGFGYPPLQAAACSLPAVVADLPPLRETLGDWPVYVNPRRPDEMASALRRLLADSNSRARMAETGPALAARFSPGTNTEAHLEVYRRVLQRSEVSLGVA